MKTLNSLKDYYKILQVERVDSTATIKRVFRKRALQMHPDINDAPDAHEKFIELNEAYQVLRNPVKRKQYHRLLAAKQKSQQQKTTSRRQKSWESSINSSAKKELVEVKNMLPKLASDSRKEPTRGHLTFSST